MLLDFCPHIDFGTATWLQAKSPKDIWFAFLCYGSTVYIGHPSRIRSDREAGVSSEVFSNVVENNRIELQLWPIEEHNAVGTGERYHALPRRIYFVFRKYYPRITETSATFAVKAMKDTMVPESWGPLYSCLV